jgi:hypothetical protein
MFKVTEQDSCDSEIEVSTVLCILQGIVITAMFRNAIEKNLYFSAICIATFDKELLIIVQSRCSEEMYGQIDWTQLIFLKYLIWFHAINLYPPNVDNWASS